MHFKLNVYHEQSIYVAISNLITYIQCPAHKEIVCLLGNIKTLMFLPRGVKNKFREQVCLLPNNDTVVTSISLFFFFYVKLGSFVM